LVLWLKGIPEHSSDRVKELDSPLMKLSACYACFQGTERGCNCSTALASNLHFGVYYHSSCQTDNKLYPSGDKTGKRTEWTVRLGSN